MIKLIVFIVLFVIVISAFSLSLGWFTNGFETIATIFTKFSNSFFNLIKTIFNSLFNAPTLSIFLILGLVFIILKYLVSMLGGGSK